MNAPIVPPLTPQQEREAVVKQLAEINRARYTVVTNIEGDKNSIAGLFPDIILQDKTTGKPMFIIEVKKNGNIAQCIQQWKSVTPIPAFLYIVVPEHDLANAKSIAQVVGIQAKFAAYTVDHNTKIASIRYE